MIAFEPSEEQQLIRESVAQFAQAALAPRVREAERLRAVPEDVRRLAHEMGPPRSRCRRKWAAKASA